MATPATRDELKEWCLRRLGKPVIDINVDEDQLEDRLDEALQFYAEYHVDGVEKVYESHQFTAEDITNEYINVPSPGWSNTASPHVADSYSSITRIFDSRSVGTGMWDIQYQLRMQDMNAGAAAGGNFGTSDMLSYEMRMNNLSLISELLVGQTPIRFQRHTNKLYLDWNWSTDATTGEYVVIEAFKILDPTTHTDVYNDQFLKEYVTALFKEQWGQNLSKFEGMQLPGGVTLNGRQILDEAKQEIIKLREEVETHWQNPVDFYMS